MDLICPYNKDKRQQKTGGAIIKNNVSIICTYMTDHNTGWFEIIKLPTFDLDEVMDSNDEYIDK